jgi:hypothetical protein
VKKVLRRAPSFKHVPFDLERPFSDIPPHGDGYGDELARGVAFGLRDALLQHWREIRSIEIVVEEARDEFDGEDPLEPEVRGQLDASKATLLEVHAAFSVYVGGIELPEPADLEVALVRNLIEKAIEHA